MYNTKNKCIIHNTSRKNMYFPIRRGKIHDTSFWRLKLCILHCRRWVGPWCHFSWGNLISGKSHFGVIFQFLKREIDVTRRGNAIFVFPARIRCPKIAMLRNRKPKNVFCIIHFWKLYYTKNKCIIHFWQKCIIETACIMCYTKNKCIIHNTWRKNKYFPI